MGIEPTSDVIQLLGVLCNRWEETIRESNRKILLHLYRDEEGASEESVRGRHKNLYAIEFPILDADFVGKGKKFANRWELILFVSHVARENKIRAMRFLFSTSKIMIIHAPGAEKFLVMSILKNGDRWTYKAFRTAEDFKSEEVMRARGETKSGIPYTSRFFGRGETLTEKGVIRPAFVKEEYGGVELPELWNLATDKEKKILEQVGRDLIPDLWMETNYTYNPATKKIYRVDVI